jgi:hypothetical protein
MALKLTTSGASNTAVGHQTMLNNTTGAENSAFGKNALDSNTTASQNTAVGYDALQTCTTGEANTAVGAYTLDAVTTANNNTAIGKNAGGLITTGIQNTMLGQNSGDRLVTGAYNVCVGAEADTSQTDAEGEIVIGRTVAGGGNNTVRFGQDTGKATLSLDGSDTSWAATSDVRLKENIKDSSAGLAFINDLRPITYNWRAKKDVPQDMSQYEEGSEKPANGTIYGQQNHGFIAQEVKEAIDKHSDSVVENNHIWSVDPDGTQQIAFGNMMPMAIKAIQELSAQVEELKSNKEE